MKILCVIPSRIGSTRLHRKPLLLVQGKPMIQRVYENARRCAVFNEVVVATDSEEIASVVEVCGGKAMMTDPNISNGSERVACVAKAHPEYEVVVNLQGDEPFIKASMLEALVAPFLSGDVCEMTTLAAPIQPGDFENPGIPKVITDIHGNAIYFSRSPIPYFRVNGINAPVFHHMGLYAFRREFLLTYATLRPTPLEQIESLEQLRVLENGYRIRVCLTTETSLEINTYEEWEAAQHFACEEN